MTTSRPTFLEKCALELRKIYKTSGELEQMEQAIRQADEAKAGMAQAYEDHNAKAVWDAAYTFAIHTLELCRTMQSMLSIGITKVVPPAQAHRDQVAELRHELKALAEQYAIARQDRYPPQVQLGIRMKESPAAAKLRRQTFEAARVTFLAESQRINKILDGMKLVQPIVPVRRLQTLQKALGQYVENTFPAVNLRKAISFRQSSGDVTPRLLDPVDTADKRLRAFADRKRAEM